jgi:putative hydrolase
MSENIFEKMMGLFNQPGPVNRAIIEEIAMSLAGPGEPLDPSLTDEYQELGNLALLQTATIADLPNLDNPRIDPVDRATWTRDNLGAFDYLAEPLGGRLSAENSMMAPIASSMIGMQLGSLIGSLSHFALGGFDVGLVAKSPRGYLIVPAVESFAREHALDSRQLRLWASLHESLHLRISSIDWIAARYASLLTEYLNGLNVDMGQIMGQMQGMTDPSQAEEMFSEGGLQGLLGESENDEARRDAQALLAVVGGMRRHFVAGFADQYGLDLVEIRKALVSRSLEPEGTPNGTMALPTLEGISAGEAFCDEVVERWGPSTLPKILSDPEAAPTASELQDPVGWAARVLLDELPTL